MVCAKGHWRIQSGCWWKSSRLVTTAPVSVAVSEVTRHSVVVVTKP